MIVFIFKVSYIVFRYPPKCFFYCFFYNRVGLRLFVYIIECNLKMPFFFR